jgi:phosphopantothenoylcysteine decarboxylase/phosphopantothenate--cysteine ligase
MYEHAAVKANLATLRDRGVTVLEPGVGALGSKNEWGVGRLAEPADLLRAVEAALRPGGPDSHGHLVGLRVLVTAGGTREPIDSVRFVGNRSSGRMGFALAEEAAALGAAVTVIAANVALERSPRVRYVDVATAAELKDACEAEFARADVLLMAAAVADYRPSEAAATKLKKDRSDTLTLTLERTDDIISALAAARRPEQTIVGFAAEHGEGAVAYGRDKLRRKGLDAVVVNDIGRTDIGFEGADNEVTIVTAAGERHVPRTSKAAVARAVLETLNDLRTEQRATA